MNNNIISDQDCMIIPPYIEGISTDRKKLEERFRLIRFYYDKHWKEIQRETGSISSIVSTRLKSTANKKRPCFTVPPFRLDRPMGDFYAAKIQKRLNMQAKCRKLF